MADISQKTIAKLRDNIEDAERALRYAKDTLKQIEEEKAQSYKELPGVEGVFDGAYMIAASGEKYEVPANYAAKSRLVYGDTLKMVEEEGKQLFKQINKVERKKIEGVLNKKEGKWYILTDSGSYRIMDRAAEFNEADVNDRAIAILPENVENASFATLDKIIRDRPAIVHTPIRESIRAAVAAPRPRLQPQTPPATASAPKKRLIPIRPIVARPAPMKASPVAPTGDSISSLKGLGDDDLR